MPAPEEIQDGPRWEHGTVALLCAIAALRVLVFSAAFPFFCNVDEKPHFDLVHKHARGYRPGPSSEGYDLGAAILIARYASPEYVGSPEDWGGDEHPVPVWSWPAREAQPHVMRRVERSIREFNYQVHSPPVYYGLAGLWYRMGERLGLEAGSLLYWLRFLNAPLVALLVLCAHRFCRRYFDGSFLRMAVVALLAFLPQDAFYAITNDVLSPLAFLVSLMLLLHWQRSRPPGLPSSLALGGAVAATFLTKLTNLALPLVFGALILVRAVRLPRIPGKLREAAAIATAALAAAVPALLWLIHNQARLGDPSGTRSKLAYLGWSTRPLTEYAQHPIFSLEGAWHFWSGLLVSFWRGEFVWHREVLGYPWADFFYSSSSLVLLGAAAVACTCRASKRIAVRFPAATSVQRDDSLALALVWSSVVGSILVLAALSVYLKFGRIGYPVEAAPFFISGRLALGALVPFLILYVRGAQAVFEPLAGRWGARLFVTFVVLVMIVSELYATWPVFSSPYNWFHLP